MRKKELMRNKEARAKTREVITLKKDTGALDAEVRRLTQAGQSGSSRSHREQLRQLKDSSTALQNKPKN